MQCTQCMRVFVACVHTLAQLSMCKLHCGFSLVFQVFFFSPPDNDMQGKHLALYQVSNEENGRLCIQRSFNPSWNAVIEDKAVRMFKYVQTWKVSFMFMKPLLNLLSGLGKWSSWNMETSWGTSICTAGCTWSCKMVSFCKTIMHLWRAINIPIESPTIAVPIPLQNLCVSWVFVQDCDMSRLDMNGRLVINISFVKLTCTVLVHCC